VNSPPDSLSAGDVVRIAGQQAGASGSAAQPSDAAGEDVAAAPGAKQH